MSAEPTGPRLVCTACAATYSAHAPIVQCTCGGLLAVHHDLQAKDGTELQSAFNRRWRYRTGLDASGVWRYRDLIGEFARPITRPEGNTAIYTHPRIDAWTGCDSIRLKHEGENPTGSFKDRGMTVGITAAAEIGAKAVICASTGNTSSSLAAYAALAGLPCIVLVPQGKIALGKLAQTMAYGARVVQIAGDFDAALAVARAVCQDMGLYLLNSVNPWRLEGQKTIVFELLQQLGWNPPDWIVLPGGNLGNTAAFGKALGELAALALIPRLPRLAVVQAAGAAPFYWAFCHGFECMEPVIPHTVATAINIGNPANYPRARQAVEETKGVVTDVSDAEIMEAKSVIDRAGIGCEPASAATVAGIRKLVRAGTIRHDDDVVGILTGHVLKDTDAVLSTADIKDGQTLVVEPTLDAIRRVLEGIMP